MVRDLCEIKTDVLVENFIKYEYKDIVILKTSTLQFYTNWCRDFGLTNTLVQFHWNFNVFGKSKRRMKLGVLNQDF